MVILFDHQTFSIQNYGGISRYFSELISGISSKENCEVKLPPFYSNNAYLPQSFSKPFLPGLEFNKKNLLLYKINKPLSINFIKKSKFDIFHPTYYDPYFFPYLKGQPVVVTFLDMIHEKFSDQYKELAHDKALIAQKRIMAEQATLIIAISENTKKDLIAIYNLDPAKIHVVYLGNSMPLETRSSTKELPQHKRPYLLFVGNRGFYKNFDRLLTAIAPLLNSYDIDLLCVGGGKFTSHELKLINSLKVDNYVSQQSVTDNELAILYNQAIAFLFPSIYEGFGIPVLEAFACQCACVLSDSSSLPEVGGSAVLYMHPTDIDSIRHSVRLLLDNESLRTELIRKGLERLKQFSWQNTVDETVKLYQTL